jgi:hypothetical protein
MVGTAEVSWSKGHSTCDRETLPADDPVRLIVVKIRLPRILLAGLVGFSLSMGGVVFQALLRNPLADPFILGVSSGAAFGAILGIFLGFSFTLRNSIHGFCRGPFHRIYLVLAIGSRRMGVESSSHPSHRRDHQRLFYGHYHVFCLSRSRQPAPCHALLALRRSFPESCLSAGASRSCSCFGLSRFFSATQGI